MMKGSIGTISRMESGKEKTIEMKEAQEASLGGYVTLYK